MNPKVRSYTTQNAQNAISWSLEIARLFCGGLKCHIWAFRDCSVIAHSLQGCSKSHIWAFGDCVVIAGCLRMLKMPFLGLWRLRAHCMVAQNMPLLAFRRLHGHCAVIPQCLIILKMPFLGLWRLRSHCALAQNAISWPLEIARSFRGHFAVAQRGISGCLETARSLRGHCTVSQNAQNTLS